MDVLAAEKLAPTKWTQHCYLKQCCRRDYAAASISVITQLLRLQKEKSPKCYFLTEESLVELMAVHQGKIRLWYCLSKVRGGGPRMRKKQEHKNQATGVWLNAGGFFPTCSTVHFITEVEVKLWICRAFQTHRGSWDSPFSFHIKALLKRFVQPRSNTEGSLTFSQWQPNQEELFQQLR